MGSKLTEGLGGRRAQPGDVLHIDAKDKGGNVVKTYTVHRTARDFVFDLCDAYNAQLPDSLRDSGRQWFVTPQGTIALGTTPQQDEANHKRAMRIMRSIDRAEMEREPV